MKNVPITFMMFTLIGALVINAPSAFGSPGVGMSANPNQVPQGFSFLIEKKFTSNCDVVTTPGPLFGKCDPATVGSENQEHSHLTFAVKEGPLDTAYSVPSNSGICAGQTTVTASAQIPPASRPFFHLIASSPPPNTDSPADIHLTFLAQPASDLSPADHKADVKFTFGTGASGAITTSGPVIVYTHGSGGPYPASGFLPYAGGVEWKQDGTGPSEAGSTSIVGNTIVGGECDFVDSNLNNNFDTGEASDVIHVTVDVVAKPPPTVGGTIIPADMTALFVAGTLTNAFWMLPTLGGIAGAAIALFKVKRKQN